MKRFFFAANTHHKSRFPLCHVKCIYCIKYSTNEYDATLKFLLAILLPYLVSSSLILEHLLPWNISRVRCFHLCINNNFSLSIHIKKIIFLHYGESSIYMYIIPATSLCSSPLFLNCSYSLTWYRSIPTNNLHAIDRIKKWEPLIYYGPNDFADGKAANRIRILQLDVQYTTLK